jgi:hypothetical protein
VEHDGAGRRELNLRFVQGLDEYLPFPPGQFDFRDDRLRAEAGVDLDQTFEEHRLVLRPGWPAADARSHANRHGRSASAGAYPFRDDRPLVARIGTGSANAAELIDSGAGIFSEYTATCGV